VLSVDRSAFQQGVLAQLQTTLRNTGGIQLARVYTDTSGDVCFFYLYQAAGKAEAAYACELLSPNGQGVTSRASSLPVTFGGVTYATTISAAPWQVESAGPFGVPLPAQWSASDLLMWSGIAGAALCVFTAGACCCIVRRVGSRDRAAVRALLEQDRQLVRLLETKHPKAQAVPSAA